MAYKYGHLHVPRSQLFILFFIPFATFIRVKHFLARLNFKREYTSVQYGNTSCAHQVSIFRYIYLQSFDIGINQGYGQPPPCWIHHALACYEKVSNRFMFYMQSLPVMWHNDIQIHSFFNLSILAFLVTLVVFHTKHLSHRGHFERRALGKVVMYQAFKISTDIKNLTLFLHHLFKF